MAVRSSIILTIVRAHLEEIQFLWGQWKVGRQSSERVSRDLRELENRIEAHIDGLRIAGDGALSLIEEYLRADDAGVVFAGAYVLLGMNLAEGARKLISTFREAEGSRLDGIKEALCHRPITAIVEDLRQAFVSPPTTVAVAAAEVLAFHSRIDPLTTRIVELLGDQNPQVRRAAWRVAAILDSVRSSHR